MRLVILHSTFVGGNLHDLIVLVDDLFFIVETNFSWGFVHMFEEKVNFSYSSKD